MMKYITRVFSIILSLFLFMFMTCEEFEDKYIQFTNNSEKGIITAYSEWYPDTIPFFYYNNEYEAKEYAYRFVPPYSTNDTTFKNVTNLFYNSDTLSFYVIDEEVYKKEGPFRVQLYNLVKQRYDLSKADMEYLEYKLSYPPSPKMRGMKMFPPYEEAIK